MTSQRFHVAVTGDTGYDIYTEYVHGYVSPDSRMHKPQAAYDVCVPSGAAFITQALRTLLCSQNHTEQLHPTGALDPVAVTHLIPGRASSHTSDTTPTFTTLIKFLIELGRFGSHHTNLPEALRARQFRPIIDHVGLQDSSVFEELVPDRESTVANGSEFDLLVIHDGAGTWRSYPKDGKRSSSGNSFSAMSLVERVLSARPPIRSAGYPAPACETPRLVVNLSQDLPSVARDPVSRSLEFNKNLTFWKTLADYRDQVCVVCSADMLRREGAAISRRLSWEQTIEDLLQELERSDKLSLLSQFRHLIVRFGIVGAAHIITHDGTRTVNLVFAPMAHAGIYRDPIEDGLLIGTNSFVLAALVQEFAQARARGLSQPTFTDAMRTGILAAMHAYDRGYKAPWDRGDSGTFDKGVKLVTDLFGSAREILAKGYSQYATPAYLRTRRDHTLGTMEVHAEALARVAQHPPASQPDWEILRDAINIPTDSAECRQDDTEAIHLSRINVGAAVVEFGHAAVLNRSWDANDPNYSRLASILSRGECKTSPEDTPDYITLPPGRLPEVPTGASSSASPMALPAALKPIYVPMLLFGKLTVVERREIESLRSIRNLFKRYLEESSRSGTSFPPISVAIFGPPGSGKSFAVKQLASSINDTLQDRRAGLEPIEYNLAQFRSVEELGDAITRASMINNEGRVPLIFFDEFDCEFGGSPLGWLKYLLAPMQDGTFYAAKKTIKIARAIFVFAGGVYPTFETFDPSSAPIDPGSRGRDETDRLINQFRQQKGPDFISRLRGHIDILPINTKSGAVKPIIRRAIILRSLLEERRLIVRLRGQDIAYVDSDVLYALLTVDAYRHGTRSMEAIIQMCSPMEGKIEKASLPSRSQLNMHVNAEEFYVRMYRGRARAHASENYVGRKPAIAAPTNERHELSQSSGIGIESEGSSIELPASQENLGSPEARDSE